MEPKVIKLLFEKVRAARDEVRILYELNEAEMFIFIQLIMVLPIGDLSTKLAGKLLRAAAHFVESTGEIAEDILKEDK